MKNTRYLELDFYRTSYRSVKAHQYDKDTRFIEVTCINDATVYPLNPETMTCEFKLVTPDKRHMFKNEIIQENGTVLITLEESMLLAAGVCKAEINIYELDSHKLLSTMPFDLIVIGSVYDNSVIEESDEFSALNDIIFYNKELGYRLEQLESDVKEAESIRDDNEAIRIDNENSRINAENSRVVEENMRASNETERQTAEEVRINNENIRLTNESDRKANEIIREENENIRKENEIARQNEEDERNSAEAIRINQENEREDSESIRKQNEINRESAEDTREQNEIDRNTAETKRKDDFKSMQDINAEELEKMKEAGSASEIASAAYAAEAKASKEAAKVSEENSKESETNAKASELASANSADLASQKSDEAEDFAITAKSYTKGGTGTRDGEDQDNAQHYYEQVRSMTERLSTALVAKGTITFEELLELEDPQPGDQYNISDEFTTTDEFKEGAGVVVPLGSNVYMTDDGYWDVLAGSPVASVNGQTGNVEITPENIGAFPGINILRNTSIDEVYASGLYYIVSCTSSGESIPNGWLLVMRSSSVTANDAIKQMYWQYNSDATNVANYSVLIRLLRNNVWTEFKKFAMEDDVILKDSTAGQWVEDTSNVLAMEKINNYWGLKITGTPNDWLRMPTSGIIPYGQSESGNGWGSIGSQSWPFAEMHANKLFGHLQFIPWNIEKWPTLDSAPTGMYRMSTPQLEEIPDKPSAYVGGASYLIKSKFSDQEFMIFINPRDNTILAKYQYGDTISDWKGLGGSSSVMTGATGTTNGTAGLVPAPLVGDQDKYLQGNGTWDTPPNNMVEQAPTSIDVNLPILFSNATSTTETHTASVRKNAMFYVNPAKKDFVAENLRTESIGNTSGSTGGCFTFVKNGLYIGYKNYVGPIVIKFPEFLELMTAFKLSIYSYQPAGTSNTQMVDYSVGFYPYNTVNGPKLTNGLYAHSVSKNANGSLANLSVRFGRDSEDGKPMVLIGWSDTVWNYPIVYLHDLMLHTVSNQGPISAMDAYQKFKDGITITITNNHKFTEDTVIGNPNIKSDVPIIKLGKEYNAIYFPNGTRNGYLEMPASGILPYTTTEEDGTGHGNIGTDHWKWLSAHINNVYANNVIMSGNIVIDTDAHGVYLQSAKKGLLYAPSANALALSIAKQDTYTAEALRLQTFTGWARFVPSTSGLCDLGSSDYRFRQIHATTATIQTSDRNLKKNISELPDELTKKFILGLMACRYQLIDGESGRYHWGFIAQDIEELMERLGLDSLDFAGFIKSPKTREVEVEFEIEVDEEYVDEETGEMKTHKVKKMEKRIEQEVIPGEYIYSLRYEEFIAPTVKVVQMLAKENEEQKKEIDALKKENCELMERMERIEKMLGLS